MFHPVARGVSLKPPCRKSTSSKRVFQIQRFGRGGGVLWMSFFFFPVFKKQFYRLIRLIFGNFCSELGANQNPQG